jgi:hypothetical protein
MSDARRDRARENKQRRLVFTSNYAFVPNQIMAYSAMRSAARHTSPGIELVCFPCNFSFLAYFDNLNDVHQHLVRRRWWVIDLFDVLGFHFCLQITFAVSRRQAASLRKPSAGTLPLLQRTRSIGTTLLLCCSRLDSLKSPVPAAAALSPLVEASWAASGGHPW